MNLPINTEAFPAFTTPERDAGDTAESYAREQSAPDDPITDYANRRGE